ncbi:MAG: hypothetical protein LKI42_00045 [Bacteroidales bacterium]|jgi:hypothetical protein|nr:hypothetical protein [Bacteroidales bacterium]MCI1785652.1 hypothetical protein [Bacteroidales bacterium]
MTKKIFIFIVLIAALISCSKENGESISPVKDAKTLVINATIGNPATKLSYTDNESGGYTATFNGNEQLQLYFLDAESKVISNDIVKVDQYSISDDGKSAKFIVTDLEIPSNAVKIFSYIDFSGSSVNYTDTLSVNDLSLQNNLSEAQGHHILSGSVNVADLTSTTSGTAFTTIKYAYKTSLLRFNLSFPVDIPVDPSKTMITISNQNKTIHNLVDFAWGEMSSDKSEAGNIVIYPTKVDTLENSVVAVACVWAADDFKDTRVTATIGEDRYYVDLNLAKTTLEAGKVYDVTRTLAASPKPVMIWTADDAGSVAFTSGGTTPVANDWLSFADGKVSWTANTTGAPRTATLAFANGSTYKVTQVVPADFKGTYDFTSKIFSNSSFIKAADPGTISGVTFGDPLDGTESLEENGKTYKNNIGVQGLYYSDVICDATVQIDYTNQTASFGLFMDGRKAQPCSSLTGTYIYACYIPEMASWGTSGWTSPWNFVQADLGTPDYTWMWFTVSDDFKTITFANPVASTTAQRLGHDPAATNDYIIGITIAISSSEDASSANVSGSYNVIYQCNKDLTFTRK